MLNFRNGLLLVMFLSLASLTPSVQADPYTDTIDVFRESPAVQPFFDNAYGYAVFPTIGKGGFGIGAAYGKGQVYKAGRATGTAELFKASIGLQMGGQVFSEIIFFQDNRAYEDFTSGEFELDATASAVVITAGAQAKVGTEGASAGASTGPATAMQADATYRKGMAVFIHTIGGFTYEASVGGQKFVFRPY